MDIAWCSARAQPLREVTDYPQPDGRMPYGTAGEDLVDLKDTVVLRVRN